MNELPGMPGAITFKTDSGESLNYTAATKNISGYNFVEVKVNEGTWILYQEIDYNAETSSGLAEIMIVKDTDDSTKLLFSPKSIWEVPRVSRDHDASATLFEHINYGGNRKTYSGGCPDITADFRIDKANGVSSMIILDGKDWELFPEKDYKPQPGKRAPPKWYESFKAIFPNDKLVSLRPC